MHNGVLHEFDALRPRLVEHIGMERRQHIAGETDSEYAGALLGHLLRQHPRHADSSDDSVFPLDDLMDAVQQLVQHLDHLDADEDLTPLDGFSDVEGLAESLASERGGTQAGAYTCRTFRRSRICSLLLAAGTGGGCDAAHSLNFAVSDGFSLVATRFRSCLEQEPPSLYYTIGQLDPSTGVASHDPSNDGDTHRPRSVVIASEPLSGPGAGAESWTLVHKDEMVGATLVDGGNRVEITRRCLSIACIADRRERTELARARAKAAGAAAASRDHDL